MTLAHKGHSSDASDRRRHQRIDCRFPATLSIVVPEETFSPFQTLVFVTNVSDDGMHVLCPASRETWLDKLDRGQYVRMLFRHEDRQARLYCQLMWICPKRRMEDGVYFEIGLRFDLTDPLTHRSVDLVQDRARATANLPRALKDITTE